MKLIYALMLIKLSLAQVTQKPVCAQVSSPRGKKIIFVFTKTCFSLFYENAKIHENTVLVLH